MTRVTSPPALVALLGLVLPWGIRPAGPIFVWDVPFTCIGILSLVLIQPLARRLGPGHAATPALLVAGSIIAASIPLFLLNGQADTVYGTGAPALWCLVFGAMALWWRALAVLSDRRSAGRRVGTAALFGVMLIYLWEVVVRGFAVPFILLPPPSAIAQIFGPQLEVLWADLQQTVLLGALRGYLIGCGIGFAVAIIADRIPALARGLLPLGNLVSALPIIGMAPIMVMWFGFGWESKAAVVAVMTVFPMLVNTLAGLGATDRFQLDLMRSYAAGPWGTLVRVRLPNALPFIFNALKINSTLALIGAIVAEFFGTPTVGMGFRISTEVARMNLDMVWATIAVAALVGSSVYGALALVERSVTSWHPSHRRA